MWLKKNFKIDYSECLFTDTIISNGVLVIKSHSNYIIGILDLKVPPRGPNDQMPLKVKKFSAKFAKVVLEAYEPLLRGLLQIQNIMPWWALSNDNLRSKIGLSVEKLLKISIYLDFRAIKILKWFPEAKILVINTDYLKKKHSLKPKKKMILGFKESPLEVDYLRQSF